MDTCHTLWVSGKLSLLEQLTIILLQKHGSVVHLWSYEKIENVPSGTVLRDAREILPYESVFAFQGKSLPLIPRGGIGSLSHWSDQFQLEVLYKEGGIYLQLDVACLKPLDFKEDYAFVAHQGKDLAAFLMKCPKGSKFSGVTRAVLSSRINANTMKDMHWDYSMQIMGAALGIMIPDCSRYFISPAHVMDLGCRKNGPFFDAQEPAKDQYIIHWSNATVNELKNNPIPGSFYSKLLSSVGLLK